MSSIALFETAAASPIVDGAVIQTGVTGLMDSISSMMPVVLPVLFMVIAYKFIPKMVKMFAK